MHKVFNSVRKLGRPQLLTIVAVAMIAYHLISTQELLVLPLLHQNLHLLFACVILFLSMATGKRKTWLSYLGIVSAIICAVYVHIFYSDIELRYGFPNTPDFIIGVILIILCLWATTIAFGPILPVFISFFIIYGVLGQHLPQPFTTTDMELGRMVARLGIGLEGIYGKLLGASATMIFLYLVFGGLLQATGAPHFFLQLGRLVGRRMRGGGAMTAVISSALVGMVTGIPTANVAITGAFTIPMMKKMGYRPEQAGAIETAASSGGQFMPPIMGSSAFIIAAVLGISYRTVMLSALIPALLYFGVMALYVQLQAMRLNVQPLREEVSARELLTYGPLFFVPLLVIIAILVYGFTAGMAAFWGVVSLVIVSLLRKQTRISLKQWTTGITDGAIIGSKIGIACASLGMMIAIMVCTGLGVRLPLMVEAFSGGNLLIALAFTMVVSILLGMGVPTPAAYVLVSMLTAPVLIRMGLQPLQAHFFCFLFAVASGMTPPVAVPAIVASQIANSPYMRTAIESAKVGMAAFLLPYLIVFIPALLLLPMPLLPAVMGLGAAIFILADGSILLCRHFMLPLSRVEATATTASLISLVMYVVAGYSFGFPIGMLLPLILIISQVWRKRKGSLSSV
ncbi:TRAP transporter permease [Chloroflexota bacterium]